MFQMKENPVYIHWLDCFTVVFCFEQEFQECQLSLVMPGLALHPTSLKKRATFVEDNKQP